MHYVTRFVEHDETRCACLARFPESNSFATGGSVPSYLTVEAIAQTAAAQEMQFGYNNDFVGYVGLPFGSNNPDHGLLCVNHEYTNEEVMFPGVGVQDETGFANMTPDLIEIEMAAHGNSIIEKPSSSG